MKRLRKWATLKKVGDIADLLFKLAAAFAALVTANFFLLQPRLQTTVTSAVFIDKDVLGKLYQGHIPVLVNEAASLYEKLNTEDLNIGINSTYGKDPAFNLCQRGSSMQSTIKYVFGKVDCTDPSLRLGRGRYYERYLLQLNDDRDSPLTDTDLRIAVDNLHAAEYRKAKVLLKNDGIAKAANVSVASPDAFRADPEFDRDNNKKVDPFYVNAKKVKSVLFRTDPGNANPAGYTDTESEFPIEWDRIQGIPGLSESIAVIRYGFYSLAFILVVVFFFLVVNDFRDTS